MKSVGAHHILALTPELDAMIYAEDQSGSIEWSLGNLDGDSATVDEAARAIERRIVELVLSLAPLLPDDAKRELVKAARIGLEHFPECAPEPEDTAEPLL